MVKADTGPRLYPGNRPSNFSLFICLCEYTYLPDKREPPGVAQQIATYSNDIQRLSSLMKFHAPRMVLLSLFAFAAMGSASATPTKTPPAVFATEPGAVETTAANPWPRLASEQTAPLLARDDHHRYDNRWQARRDDRRRENWRRDQWRREQARREAERRHHDRAMHQRYDNHHRDYRR